MSNAYKYQSAWHTESILTSTNVLALGSGSFLRLDQATPQTVTGTPVFDDGITTNGDILSASETMQVSALGVNGITGINYDALTGSENLSFQLADSEVGSISGDGNLSLNGNGVFGGAVTGSNLSGTNTGDSSGHSGLVTTSDLAAKSSIKKTWSFGRTWTTGDSNYIKTKQVFYASSTFVRVYKDSVLLTYTTDWTFNTTKGKSIGAVSSLADGIVLVSPTNGSVYLVEFDEYLVPFSPVIGICRSDGAMVNKGLPRNTVADNGRSGLISNIEYDDGTNEYTITYAKDGGGTFTLMRRYADRAFCANFDFNKALPTGWRIEVYKVGRHWSGTRASAPASENTTMNSTLSPRSVYTTNIIALEWLFDKKRSGEVKIRLRNTTTNEVSTFSFQTIKSRQFKYVNRSWARFGTRINKITLD